MDIFRTARQNFLRRQAEAEQDDLERQLVPETAARQPEMREQNAQDQPEGRPPAGMSRPSIASLASRLASRGPPRPTSSHYDDSNSSSNGSEAVSPKTPPFALGMPPMPSTRLHLPSLQRTWTQGSNGPPSRPGTSTGGRNGSRTRLVSDIAEPVPLVPAEHLHRRRFGGAETAPTESATESSYSSRWGRRRRRFFEGADPAEMQLAAMANDGRQRRRQRHGDEPRRFQWQRQRAGPRAATAATSSSKPKRFLFCFPYVRTRRMRALILRCFVSGTFLALMLGVFLALSMTHNIYNSEFAVLLVLILLLTVFFFAHSLIRICILVVRPPTPAEEEAAESRYRQRRAMPSSGMAQNVHGPGGYVVPQEPIRVVLARDEEAAGLESVTAKIQPPAYGLWRESVRVDPNRIYWQRNAEAAPSAADGTDGTWRSGRATTATTASSSTSSASSQSETGTMYGSLPGGPADTSHGRASPRPPSYVSDDGVQYVIEAQPRSIAPAGEVPLQQRPAEAGRGGGAAAR